MKTMLPRMMMPLKRLRAVMKDVMGKKHRLMPNHNVHIITHHGKMMLGRKGRNA